MMAALRFKIGDYLQILAEIHTKPTIKCDNFNHIVLHGM